VFTVTNTVIRIMMIEPVVAMLVVMPLPESPFLDIEWPVPSRANPTAYEASESHCRTAPWDQGAKRDALKGT
jgi:hypothetical protein